MKRLRAFLEGSFQAKVLLPVVAVMILLTGILMWMDSRRTLKQLQADGVENVIALRGDPPKGEASWKPHPEGYHYAAQLVKACREMGFFAITGHGVPDYPNYDTLIDWARPGEAKHPPVRSGAYRDLKYARIGLAGAGALAPGTA